MKKVFVCLLALLLCMACMSFANAEKPGDQVTVPITLNNTNAAYVKIRVSYDTSVFDLVSFSSNGQQNGTTFNMSSLSGVPSGQCATITLKIKDTAPAGTYSISASVVEAWTANETAATVSASGGRVTVEKPADPTATPTVKPADPTPTPTTKPADPTATPTVKPADPTVKPADPTVKPADPTVKPADPTVKPADPTPTVKPTPTPKPQKQLSYYYNNTMTSYGPTTRELVGGKDWYRVTPVDLSIDGVYTYDLIASNRYVVGTVTIKVEAGELTVSYDVEARPCTVKKEALKIYASKADLAADNAIEAKFGEPINAAENFGSDTKVIVSLILTGDYATNGSKVTNMVINKAEIAAMIANMD